MTDTAWQEFASDYFAAHLDAAFWASAESKQAAALKMAVADILALLCVDESMLSESEPGKKAVVEQALFLLRNYDSMIEGKVVMAESVEGLSNSYALIGNSAGISPRAEQFAMAAKRSFRRVSVPIVRG